MVAQTDLNRPVDLPEILRAVETLYNDKIKPYGRLLMIRLTEHADQGGRANPEVKEQRIRSICETSLQLSVQNEKGGEWSVLMRSRPDCFVDFHSPEDIYPAELWEAAVKHFANPDEADRDLPRARYLCARALEARELPFLVGRPLGELMHIVQLAISVKKILGYQKDAIVPYNRSKNKLKEQSAASQQHHAAEGTAEQGLLATWPQTRVTLQKVMRRQHTAIPLSRVKQLFEAESGLKLSETALGHAKLSDLLNDERLADVLTVELQSRVYMVCPVFTPGQKLTLDDLIAEGSSGSPPMRTAPGLPPMPTASDGLPLMGTPPMGMPPMGMPPMGLGMWPMHMPPPAMPGVPPMVPMPPPMGMGMPPMYPTLPLAMKNKGILETVCETASHTDTETQESVADESSVARTPSAYHQDVTGMSDLSSAGGDGMPALTPGGLEMLGYKVKNGFIDYDELASPAGPMMGKSFTEPPKMVKTLSITPTES